jgi:hypothetical protein
VSFKCNPRRYSEVHLDHIFEEKTYPELDNQTMLEAMESGVGRRGGRVPKPSTLNTKP